MKKIFLAVVVVLASISYLNAQQVAGTGATGPLGSVIGYNAAGHNWLYVPVDTNGYLMVDCPGCTSSSSLPTATLAGQVPATNAAGTTYFASQQCVDATLYPGSGDLGAQIAAALAALPTYQDLNNQNWVTGCVRIPWSPTFWTWTTGITINSPFESLIGDPSLSQIRYNGSGDMILVQQAQQPSGIHQWQPNTSPTIANLAVLNMTSAGTSAVHIIDTYGVHLQNDFVTAFNGGNGGDQDSACNTSSEPTAYGYWIENYNQFSENTIFDEVEGYDNCIGLRMDIKSGGSGGTNSFAYTNFKSLSFGLRANEIGISLENGTFLYNASGRIKLESTSNTAIGVLTSGNATWGSVNAQNGGVNQVNFESECVAGTGCSGSPMTLIDNTGSANFTNIGYVIGLNSTTQNVNTSTGQFQINTDVSSTNTLYYHQWAADGGYRTYFNNTLGANEYSNNWRLANGLNVGWSNSPSGSGDFLGISPVSNGSSTLCVNTGTVGTCNGNLSIGTLTTGGNVAIAGSINATINTTGVTVQSGIDSSYSGTLGGLVLRGANNSGTGIAGGVIVGAGRNTGTGQQGYASMQQSYTLGSALTSQYQVVSPTTTSDQVQAAPLGATNVLGIAESTAAGQVYVVNTGKTTVVFDGTPTIGHVVCAPPASTGTAGLAHDNGSAACTSSAAIGTVTGQVVGSGSGATATVLIALNPGVGFSFASQHGNTTVGQSFSGTSTSGDVAVYDASGNLVDLGNGLVLGGALTVGSAEYIAGSIAATVNTTGVTMQGGQDSSYSGTLGGIIVRGANNSGTGIGGIAILRAGDNSSTGQQGYANVQQSYTTASALGLQYEVVSMTTTSDQVQAAPLASTSIVGIAQSTAAGQVYVVAHGKTTVVFDGTPVVGDVACGPPASTGTAGRAHDNGSTACASGQNLGVVTGQVVGSGSGATATVQISLP